jgi:pyruvate kinase
MLKTKIVCTIGPSSREPAVLREIILAGMDVARLNFSHGDQGLHGENIERIRRLATELNRPVAILIDLQGPKLRVGDMPESGIILERGGTAILTSEEITGHIDDKGLARIPLQYTGLPQEVVSGDRILIDDGLLELVVRDTSPQEIECDIVAGGTLKSNKGLNLPDASLSIPAITDKDWKDLQFALAAGVDWVALSFVRSADEVHQLKKRIAELSEFGRPVPVMAKIEKPEAVDQIDGIVAESDGIMVARGDLGIETAPERVPMVQKMIIAKCNAAGVPVVTATQMLDSMIRNPRPTRAEASDVANAILDGTDAVMLSGETAVGLYPLEAVKTMVKIIGQVESSQALHWERPDYTKRSVGTVTDALSHATCETAHDLGAAAIVSATASGRTALAVARFRPSCPIIAVTPSPMVQRRLLLVHGVWPLLGRRAENTDEMLAGATQVALDNSLVKRGDTIVITAGISPNMPGSTDLMKVATIPEILARGTGVMEQVVFGRVRVLESSSDLSPDNILPDDILVVRQSDRTMIPLVRRAGGLITQEGGPGSHGYMLAMELGVPAVVGAEHVLDKVRDGIEITMDTGRGLIFAGRQVE